MTDSIIEERKVRIHQTGQDLCLGGISFEILFEKYSDWTECSGCSHPDGHHYGRGGLIRHVEEVINTCMMMGSTYKADLQELYLSALFHDVGKSWDYKQTSVFYEDWGSTDHKFKIHHITRSVLVWNELTKDKFDQDLIDRVTHNILSHHGRREWGSPVEPQTKEAWILHTCDTLSARADEFRTP